ncbi:MAG TPA: hypothetical protein VK638_11605, partial [Edaphobacter sp.]|nr:hypothetical protein [Edaphobacter sp.]
MKQQLVQPFHALSLEESPSYYNTMQSVFSPAARRQRLKGLDAEGRGGELKTGWTKPLYETSSYGFSIVDL